MRRVGIGVVTALLVCQSSSALAGTVAYWRFEAGPADGPVLKGGEPDGVFYPGVTDVSGNGNDLSAWSEGDFAGYAYRTDVPAATVPQTGAGNSFSVQNTGDAPGMFTQTGAPIQSISPAAFTIEASIKPETGGYRTIVGRDSQGSVTDDEALAALYLQLLPGDAVAIKFSDVSGFWHEAISEPGVIEPFVFPDSASGEWYHIAAVSDGSTLSLYVNNTLVAQTDLTLSGSPDTALSAGLGDGEDWDAGNWSVGRGLHNGGHVDRFYGLIDEVRISDSALDPGEFLFIAEQMHIWPDALVAAPIDEPVTVNLVIPTTCNQSQAVDVTVTSDNPAAARPAGSQGSTVVHFPAGGESSASLPVEFIGAGQANFTLTANPACAAGPSAALTVNVPGLQGVDLQLPFDVMGLGLTQQAGVIADYGDAGTRDVSAGTFGTIYSALPAGVVDISADGEITAVGEGTTTVTATYDGVTSPERVIAVMSAGNTVAYWRFEEGPADAPVAKGGVPDGEFYPGVLDSTGNGNHLSAWSEGGYAGYAYRTDRAAESVPETGAANNFSVSNTGGVPGMFTETGAPIQSISPAAFTIEVSFKPESGGYRTLVGRDSQGSVTDDPALAALYLQILPGDALAIKYSDVSGYWHQAVSAEGVIQGFPWPDVEAGRWYHAAAVSDGSTLSLYLDDVDAGTGYLLVAQTDLTLSGSPDTALTAGTGDGGDWDAGNWTVGRGLFDGNHVDRGYGFIDEVRISDTALHPSQFLFTPEYMVLWPDTIDAAPIDAPVTVSLLIPAACNESQPVDVTITSDNPAVAKPAGSQGSTVVSFPAGAGRLQPVDIEFGAVGVANFTLTPSDGCPTGPATALTVTVHPLDSVDLQVTHDLMHVGMNQQATVTANFGPAGDRDITAGSFGTTYAAVPSDVVNVSSDGQVTAVDLGTAAITATYGGITSPERTVAVRIPDPRIKVAGSGVLLVDLNATDATAGQATWLNKGSLGDFTAIGQPILDIVSGQQAVSFSGTEGYQGPLASEELVGNQARSIEVWAFNPVVECSECLETMVALGHRAGPCGGNAVFGYGDHPEWGAFGAFCAEGDLAWDELGGAPTLGEWHHLVYTYDPDVEFGRAVLYDNGVDVNSKFTGPLSVNPGHINLAMQNLSADPMDLFAEEVGILSLAVVRIHDGVLTPDDVVSNYNAGITGQGEVPPDLNSDTHVDQTDLMIFIQCADGPEVSLTAGCGFVDFDNDGDGDQHDFAIFQRCYTGPDIVASPDCME